VTPETEAVTDPADRSGLPEWHVAVEGCLNFRDAGGWDVAGGGRMRRGRVYRSDDPVRLTERGRATVRALGLRLVVDLRQQSQFVRSPGFLPADRTAHVPLVDRVIDPDNPPSLTQPSDIADLYEGMLGRSQEPLAHALDLIAGQVTEGPVLVHCAYGKDRAGLVVALVQSAVGVPAASIVADYERSHAPAERRLAWLTAEPLDDDPDTSHVPGFLFSAHGETMRLLLDRLVARYGGLDEWAASLPVRPDTVTRLRDALIEL
jgi:protein-tyrosine phosphatase